MKVKRVIKNTLVTCKNADFECRYISRGKLGNGERRGMANTSVPAIGGGTGGGPGGPVAPPLFRMGGMAPSLF